MRKILILLSLVHILVFMMLAGCGSSAAEGEPSEEGTESEAVEDTSDDGEKGDTGRIFEDKDDDTGDASGNADGESMFDPDDKADSDDSWREAYREYLDANPAEDGGYGYALIYVDDDDIPELVIDTQFEAGGCQILTWHDGKTDVLQTSRLYFTYIEKGNLLNNEDGHMGYYYDLIYSIENGKWKEVFAGEYSGFAEDGSDEYDEETGRYICTDYLIDGKETDRKTYNKELKKVYDFSAAKDVTSYISYEDLLSFLDTGKYMFETHRYELVTEDCTWDQARAACEKKGGYLACMTTDEEFETVENLIRKEDRTNICFYVGAMLDENHSWVWIEPGLTQKSCLGTGYYKHWLNGGPSYTETLSDGTEIQEDRCELLYKKDEDKFYLNDVTNDVPGVYPSYRGRIGYICEYAD